MFFPVPLGLGYFWVFPVLKVGGLCFRVVLLLTSSSSGWVTLMSLHAGSCSHVFALMLLRSVDKSCILSFKGLPLPIPLVMAWFLTSWVADVVGDCSLIRIVVFLSLRVAASLGRLVLWGRITVHKKLS